MNWPFWILLVLGLLAVIWGGRMLAKKGWSKSTFAAKTAAVLGIALVITSVAAAEGVRDFFPDALGGNGLGFAAFSATGSGSSGSTGSSEQKASSSETTGVDFASACNGLPSAPQLVRTCYNSMNTSGNEQLNCSTVLYQVDKNSNLGLVNLSLGTTTETVTTLSCGSYAMPVLAQNGPEGHNTYVDEVSGSGVDNLRIETSGDTAGWIYFDITDVNNNLQIGLRQHGVLQARAADLEGGNGDLMWNLDGSQTDYETLSATATWFNSTTANTTATSLGTGSPYSFKLQLQATSDAVDFINEDMCAIADLSKTVYDDPTATLGGVALVEMLESMSTEAKDQYINSEFAFCTDDVDGITRAIENNPVVDFIISGNAEGDQDPAATDDICVDFVSKAQFLDTDGRTVLKDYVDHTTAINEPFDPMRVCFDIA